MKNTLTSAEKLEKIKKDENRMWHIVMLTCIATCLIGFLLNRIEVIIIAVVADITAVFVIAGVTMKRESHVKKELGMN